MAERPGRDPRRRAVRGSLVAVVLAVAAGAFLAAWPCFYVAQTATAPGSTAALQRMCAGTLIGENGLWVIWLLLIPVAFAAAGWLGATARKRIVLWVVGFVTLGFCFLGIFSIGMYYLPTAVALLVTAATGRRRERHA